MYRLFKLNTIVGEFIRKTYEWFTLSWQWNELMQFFSRTARNLFENSRKKSIEAHLSVKLKMWKMSFKSMEKSILIEPLSCALTPDTGLLLQLWAFFSLFYLLVIGQVNFGTFKRITCTELHSTYWHYSVISLPWIECLVCKLTHSLHNSFNFQTNKRLIH